MRLEIYLARGYSRTVNLPKAEAKTLILKLAQGGGLVEIPGQPTIDRVLVPPSQVAEIQVYLTAEEVAAGEVLEEGWPLQRAVDAF